MAQCEKLSHIVQRNVEFEFDRVPGMSLRKWLPNCERTADTPRRIVKPMDVKRTSGEAGADSSLRERVRRAAIKTEAEIIRETLERHRWNRRRTAEALRISYRSLMYKMKNCNLRDEEQPLRALEP